jgi:hypothetical protein
VACWWGPGLLGLFGISFVICAMAMGLFLFLLVTPQLRQWLGMNPAFQR